MNCFRKEKKKSENKRDIQNNYCEGRSRPTGYKEYTPRDCRKFEPFEDYKGNIIPEKLATIFIPNRGFITVNKNERTLFDDYHEKRHLIKKPRVYLFQQYTIDNKSHKFKSEIKPMITKHDILFDDDLIKCNFESKDRYNTDKVVWKECFKRQIYVESKSIYEHLINDLFKNEMKLIECTQADFYDENGRFNIDKYLYHYTDAESAFSILADGYIYPYKLDHCSNNKKFIELDLGYDLKTKDFDKYPKKLHLFF
jgi:hypothetical protein